MRHATRNLLAAILFTSSAAYALDCPRPDSRELAGFWESRQTSKGGIGHTLELRPDGTYVEAATVMVSSSYQLSGDRLILEEVPETRIKIQGDTLTQTGQDGSTLRKERVGKAGEGSPAIVGVWRYRHYTGATAFEKYTEDGRLLLRIPLAGSTGCYTVTGGRLSMTSPGRGSKEIPFESQADELVLHGPGKEATTYARETAGAWYDREHLPQL
jgi:hypothetical protein